MCAFRSVPFGLLVPSALLAASGCADIPQSESAAGPALYAPQIAPSALILSPEAGEQVEAGVPVSMVGRVSDPDGSTADLVATWSINGEVACGAVTPDAEGLVTCEATAEAGGAEVELSVEDADGLTATGSVSFEVEAGPGPSITLEAPDTQKNYSDVEVAFTGTIAGEGDLELQIDSNQDGDAFAIELDDDGTFTATATLSPGEHVITAMVTDGDGASAIVGSTIFVDGPNTAPDCVVLTPDGDDRTIAGESTTMTAIVDDDDLGPSALRVMWSSDIDGYLGEGQFDTATGMLELGVVLSEGTHALSITAIDEVGARCTDTIDHVVGTPPTVEVSGPEGMVDEGDLVELEATVYGAAPMDGGLVARWSVGGVLLDITPIDGDGHTSLSSSSLPPGQNTVLVDVTDADGWSVAGATELVINGRPSAPILSGGGRYTTADDLEGVLVREGIDPELYATTTRYQWFVNGSATSVSSSPTFPAAATARGDEITLHAYASDGRIDSEPAVITFVIDNAAPQVTWVSMVPSSPTSADLVTCDANVADHDGDPVTMRYLWRQDGRTVATGATLSPGTVPGGSAVSCVVEAFDGSEGANESSSTVIMGRSAPVLSGLSFDTPQADTDTVLGASFDLSDFDNDDIRVEYSWTVNGAPAGNLPTLDGDVWFEVGDSVSLTTTPVDDQHRGIPSTVSIVIADAPIVAADVAIEGDRTREGEDMVCAITSPGYDPDGDAVGHTIDWFVDGEAWTGDVFTDVESGDTISGDDTVDGQEWTCVVTAASATDQATSSAERRIKSAPATYGFSISTDAVLGADDTCTGAEAVADGTLVEPTYGQDYIAVPLPKLDSVGVTSVTVTVEAAACNAAEGATGTFMWGIVGPDLVDPIAGGTADLSVPTGCTCPDAGDVLELTGEVAGPIEAGVHQLVFTIDADSFSLLDDGAGNVVSVELTY